MKWPKINEPGTFVSRVTNLRQILLGSVSHIFYSVLRSPLLVMMIIMPVSVHSLYLPSVDAPVEFNVVSPVALQVTMGYVPSTFAPSIIGNLPVVLSLPFHEEGPYACDPLLHNVTSRDDSVLQARALLVPRGYCRFATKVARRPSRRLEPCYCV